MDDAIEPSAVVPNSHFNHNNDLSRNVLSNDIKHPIVSAIQNQCVLVKRPPPDPVAQPSAVEKMFDSELFKDIIRTSQDNTKVYLRLTTMNYVKLIYKRLDI